MINNLSKLEKSDIYNLLIVRTPFQLINAYEAVNYFKLKNNILIVIDNGTKNNKKQLTGLIEDDFWKTIVRFGSESKSNFFSYISLIKNLNKIKIDNFFIGSGFNKIQQILVSNLDANNKYFIDAGTSTLVTYKNICISQTFTIYDIKMCRY